MANQLKMAIVQAILQLHALRWSQRRIAAELEIDRGTVRRYLSRHVGGPNAAIPPSGCECPNAATGTEPPARLDHAASSIEWSDCAGSSNSAIPPPGSCGQNATRAGRRSECEAHQAVILVKLGERLSAQRIWQDLVAERGFTASYDSVKRFVRRLGYKSVPPFRRLECAPGTEAQVDFGTGAPIVTCDGRRRKTHVFRIVLSHSRKGYSEATFTQTAEDFFRALENAFAHFGGVPQTLVTDNLKAAVAHPDWFDPELTPKVSAAADSAGTMAR
jgi:transposase